MNRSKRNKFAWMLATVAFPVTTSALTGHVNAGCAPATPVTDTTVTCTGATYNQNGTSGYGDANSTRNTINVANGASVTGTNVGIVTNGFFFGSFSDATTINNFGVISGATGIEGNSGVVNNNTGATIAGTGAGGIGYLILSQGSLTDSGTITGTGTGVDIQNGTVTNNTSATISGGNIGVIIQDENLDRVAIPTIVNAGSITGGTIGVRFDSQGQKSGDLTNSGTISATGVDGVGAAFGRSGTATNSGTISSNAVQAANNLVINNPVGGLITGDQFGVDAAAADVTNAGRID